MTESFDFLRPEGVRVTYRRMKFDFEQGFDRYWHSQSPFKSMFWTQLSTAFEPGERFFIDSARALKDKTDDAALLTEIAEFCKQEGHHTAQHIKFDKVNAAMGIDVAGTRRVYERILGWARRSTDPVEMLAVTCALEHFTSGFADVFFGNPHIAEGEDPRVRALWMWHAAEEAEHRGTCFDLYRAIGGGYWKRIGTMLVAWTLILSASLINTLVLVHKEGTLFSRDTLRGLAYLFGRRGLVTSLLPTFFSYFHPRFHPWQGHDAADIQRWQAENARYIQNLDELEPRQVA
jgi:predicted metal-dependent hydrolase